MKRMLLLLLLAASCTKKQDAAPDATPAAEAPKKEPLRVALPETKPAIKPSRPLYYERELTAADLEGRSLYELNLMRNWIYARAGNPFVKQWLHEFFSAEPWYQPKTLDESKLSAVDKKNATLIAEHETSIPKEELKKRREVLIAKHEYALQGPSYAIAYSPDGKWIASGRESLELWDAPTGRLRAQLEPPPEVDHEEPGPTDDVAALAFSPDGKKLAVVRFMSGVRLFEVESGKELGKWSADLEAIEVAFTRVDPWQVTISDGSTVKSADLGALKPIENNISFEKTLNGARFTFYSPDKKRAANSFDGRVEIVDTASNTVLWILESPDHVAPVAFSPDGKKLAAGTAVLRLFDSESGAPVASWTGHEPFPSDDVRIELQLLSRSLGLPSPAGDESTRSPLDDPNLLEELITVDRLKDLSRRDLRLIRNTIFARRGRPFKMESVKNYFERMDWYKADPSYSDKRLTKIDHQNIKIVLSVERERGGPMTETEQLYMEMA